MPYMPFNPAPMHLSTIDMMPADSTMTATAVRVDVWSNGLEPLGAHRATEPYSGAVALLVVLMALLAFMSPQLKRIFSAPATDLLGVRRRANAFDEHTSSETRALAVMLMLCWACEAILIAVAINPLGATDGKLLGCMAALTVGYYVFQYTAYAVIGYTFSDNVGMHQWLKGFNLSQATLGLLLALPTIAVMYYHSATQWVLVVALVLYLLTRIAFLCKGFRIFYDQLASLVYFILYLCTVEIVPVIILVRLARSVAGVA